MVESSATDCQHVAVWTPATKSIRRFSGPPEPCEARHEIGPVALAGTRAAWLWTSGTGNTMETAVKTATLAHAAPPWPYLGHSGMNRGTGAGGVALGPAGDGELLAFAVQEHCDEESDVVCPPGRRTGQLVGATVYRVSAASRCPAARRVAPIQCIVSQADGPLNVLAVDAGRIVVSTATGTRVVTTDGTLVRDLPARARTAALSGNRLALQTSNGVELYDVSSGRRAARVSGVMLDDLDGEILVTTIGSSVTLRRLGDGATARIAARGPARAQLEPAGLFVAGDHTVTFMPMAEVRRRLAG